jgi:homospermidine synthase
MFAHGMNPGNISHLTYKGIYDAAKYFLTRREWKDLDYNLIQKHLEAKNIKKLAQALGLHTIHCCETDGQFFYPKPSDVKTKLYNNWSL